MSLTKGSPIVKNPLRNRNPLGDISQNSSLLRELTSHTRHILDKPNSQTDMADSIKNTDEVHRALSSTRQFVSAVV